MVRKSNNKIYNGIIYKYTNIINGKVYIGQTVREKQRKREHVLSGRAGKERCLFDYAISKYGINNFKYEVIFRIYGSGKEVEQRLNFFEKFYISKFKSNNKQFGYNLTAGGDGSLGWSPSTEAREKMRKNHADFRGEKSPLFGRKRTKEQIQKTVQSHLGTKASKETLEKMSKSHKNRGTRQIMCIETSTIYSSVLEAAQQTQIGYSNLRKCAQGYNKTAGGYHWKYICGRKY